MGAQLQVGRVEVLVREGFPQAGGVGGQLLGRRGERGGGLAVPQAVLDAMKAGEILVVHAVRQSVGPSVDLLVEVLEGAVGGAEGGIGAVRGEPVGAGLAEVVVPDVVGQGAGLGHESSQALVDVRPVLRERAGEVVCRDRTTAFAAPPPVTRTTSEVTAVPPLGTHRQAYAPSATVATRARVVPGARPSISP